MSERLRWAFAVGGLVGAVIGYRWGQAERIYRKIAARVRQLLIWAFGFLATYFVLEIGLPQLGRKLPVIYEDPYFWCLVGVRVVLWALFVGTLARLFPSLERSAAAPLSGRRFRTVVIDAAEGPEAEEVGPVGGPGPSFVRRRLYPLAA